MKSSNLLLEVLYGLQDMVFKMNKKIFTIVLIFLFLVLATNFVSAASYCCEKTVSGAWCQNAPEDQCVDSPFRKAPTSCESTAYCKLGTCVDVGEGLCQENTPQRVCDTNDGVWYSQAADALPQCQLGCCLLGDQAAFVTQTRCKTLSSIYGLETNFRNDLNNEFMCIASASSDKKGACVIEKEGERTCKMITQRECQSMESISSISEEGGLFEELLGGDEINIEGVDVSFHEGYLCSADVLATNCGPGRETTCVNGKDQVYYLDTCGNLANIYDYNKRNDQDYWTYIKGVDESCGYEQSNANSRTCGNCDYYAGSTCKSVRTTNSPAALYGDYVCGDLSCIHEEERYEHGEVWCDENTKENLDFNLPGSESFRLLCYNGDVTIEPCDAWRSSVCTETKVEGFTYAACKANMWQDCVTQETEKDCLNIDKRDCEWVGGMSVLRTEKGEEKKLEPLIGKDVKATCVPKNPPGFDFWNTQTEAVDLCDIGTYHCVVKYRYNIFMDKDNLEKWKTAQKNACIENCKCLPGYDGENNGNGKDKCNPGKGCESNKDFLESFQGICGGMGDCGIEVNYMGIDGYYEKYEIDFSQIE